MAGKWLTLAGHLRGVLSGFALGILYTFCFSLSRRTLIVMIVCFALAAAIDLAGKLEKPATSATAAAATKQG